MRSKDFAEPKKAITTKGVDKGVATSAESESAGLSTSTVYNFRRGADDFASSFLSVFRSSPHDVALL